jgi:hypothetical protein
MKENVVYDNEDCSYQKLRILVSNCDGRRRGLRSIKVLTIPPAKRSHCHSVILVRNDDAVVSVSEWVSEGMIVEAWSGLSFH